MKGQRALASSIAPLTDLVLGGCAKPGEEAATAGMNDADIDHLVQQSYRFVAMYNVIDKGAIMEENPTRTGWNGAFAASGL